VTAAWVGEELAPPPKEVGNTRAKVFIFGVMETDNLEALKKADWRDVLTDMVDRGIKINYRVELEEKPKKRKKP